MAEKILVVDDDLETLVLIGKMLQGHGYTILAANNGTQALTMARKEVPDLIVLDIMMPDMDGYQVTEEIRKDPEIGETPIIMFTAKGQVDDKVAGYEAGADDYLTKPVHPIELVAHVRSLLARAKPKPLTTSSPAAGMRKCFTVGVIGAKGGLGTSTLVKNLSASYAQLTKSDVIAAELRPGQGCWAGELGISPSNWLENLLALDISAITPQACESSLTGTSFGVRLLLASNKLGGLDCDTLGDKASAIINSLSKITNVLFLDIGTPFFPGFEKVITRCQEILILTDALPTTVKRARTVIEEVGAMTSTISKNIDLVLYNHTRSEMQLTADQVSKMIPTNQVRVMIPAVPELIYQAIQKQVPLSRYQPDNLFSQQIQELAKLIQSRAE